MTEEEKYWELQNKEANTLDYYWENDEENEIYLLVPFFERIITNKKLHWLLRMRKAEEQEKKWCKSKWVCDLNTAMLSEEMFPVFIKHSKNHIHALMMSDLEKNSVAAKKSIISQLNFSLNLVKKINIRVDRKSKISDVLNG